VTVVVQGDYGKPRPAVVIQSDGLVETDSVLVCLLTSTMRETPLYRLAVPSTPETGLQRVSQVIVDKMMAVRREKCGPSIGRLDEAGMLALDRLLALVVGLADG
jgi:mRNA interferase MazF